MPNFEEMLTAMEALRDGIIGEVSDTKVKERRTVAKRFYLTEEEDRRLEELRQGVGLSAFVRAKVFGSGVYRPRAVVPQIHRETYIQLSSIRSNCNQIAKAVNIAAKQGKPLPLTEDYLEQLARLENLLRAVQRQLNQSDKLEEEEFEP